MVDNMSDGMKKNLEVVRAELVEWRKQMADNTARFRHVGLVNKGSGPYGQNNNLFHLLTNYISESYRALPRTLTYITIVALVITTLEALT